MNDEHNITIIEFLNIAKDHFNDKGSTNLMFLLSLDESFLSSASRKKMSSGYVTMHEFSKAKRTNDLLLEEVRPLRAEFKEVNKPQLKVCLRLINV